ncbi:MAG: zinc-ribbon domain-containing protein [Blastocatellia bacterium]
MYCPKCAAQTIPGQRFCRNCGANIGVIVDAIENKQRGPIDFETLKSDLRELGTNLRAGFEQFKGTHRLDKPQAAQMPASIQPQYMAANIAQEIHQSIKNDIERGVNKGLRKTRIANSRKYSLQQGMLSIFGGGAALFAWNALLNNTGTLIASIEKIVLQETGAPIQGVAPAIQVLWVLATIPIARGVAHLINGIFIVPKQQELSEPVAEHQPQSYGFSPPYGTPAYATPAYATPAYATPVSAVPPASHIAGTTTNELNQKAGSLSQPSVTEDSTLRLETRPAE